MALLAIAGSGVVGVMLWSMAAPVATSPSDDARSRMLAPGEGTISAPSLAAAPMNRLAIAAGGPAANPAAVDAEAEPPWGRGGVGGPPPEPFPAATMEARSTIDDVPAGYGAFAGSRAPKRASAVGARVSKATIAPGSSDRSTAPPDWERLHRRGRRAQQRNRLNEATELFQQASILNPTDAAILYDLGHVLQLQGRYQAAMDKYQRVIQLYPDHEHALYNLGWLMRKVGDFGATTLYRRVIEVAPDSEPATWAREQLDTLLVGAELEP